MEKLNKERVWVRIFFGLSSRKETYKMRMKMLSKLGRLFEWAVWGVAAAPSAVAALGQTVVYARWRVWRLLVWKCSCGWRWWWWWWWWRLVGSAERSSWSGCGMHCCCVEEKRCCYNSWVAMSIELGDEGYVELKKLGFLWELGE